MNLESGIDQYLASLKSGQKYYKTCMSRNQYPYLPVLDELAGVSLSAGTENIGIIDVPSELVVGTKTAGRRTSFAGNFMPLLQVGSEFASKWITLCNAHLGAEGIHDPVTCYEYLGKFYVEEGNKRVSVLKSFDAPMIPAKVIRILPVYMDIPEIEMYYEFIQFYRYSRLYTINFSFSGSYTKLQAALGFDSDHVWTDNERRSFNSDFIRFRSALKDKNIPSTLEPGDVFLVWLRTHEYSQLKSMPFDELTASINDIIPDLKVLSDGSKIEFVTRHQETAPLESFLSRIIGPHRPSHLNVAFIHSASPDVSPWVKGHEMGRIFMEKQFGDAVTSKTYITDTANSENTVLQAINDGAQLIFATTPPLISACLKLAPKYPSVKFLNCALSMPFTGIRTYYGKIYEAKFITGAIAGAMCKDDYIGYIANYPIYGSVAAINAFALGAQLTHPGVTIKLRWTCLPGDPIAQFKTEGVRVISNRDTIENENKTWSHDYGTYINLPDGSSKPLTSSCWNWGKLYTIILKGIFDTGWSSWDNNSLPINYWWGFSSGVIDVELSSHLPAGIQHLAAILKQGIKDGSLEPFTCFIEDQSGNIRNNGEHHFTAEEIMKMNWLCSNVEGRIPEYDELMEQSKEIVRLLGVYRDSIPPEKEGVLI